MGEDVRRVCHRVRSLTADVTTESAEMMASSGVLRAMNSISFAVSASNLPFGLEHVSMKRRSERER